MKIQDRYTALGTATPSQLEKIDLILEGRDCQAPQRQQDNRLLMMGDAAKELNVSRATVYRLIKEGRLPTVELRAGTLRIPSQAITDFVNQTRKAS